MGAASCGLCQSNKKPLKTNAMHPIKVVQRPTVHDLSSSMDDYEAHVEARSDLLAARVDHKEARIGLSF